MIVDCAVYRDGERLPMTVADALASLPSPDTAGAFTWLGLVDVTAEELQPIADRFGLHPLAVEDALKAHQRPKLEAYGHTLFLVVRTLARQAASGAVEAGELAVFIGPEFVVTVRHGHVRPLAHLRADLESDRERLRSGPSAVLHRVLDAVVDDYLEVVGALEEAVEDLEQEVIGGEGHARTTDIYFLIREIIECRRATGPLVEPLNRLARDPFQLIDDTVQPFFGDIADHAMRAHEAVESLNDLLTAALNASFAQIQVRQNEIQVQQNEDMRKISAWVALAAVPTMVAGIYGMNFQHMPELGWTWSYPAVMGGLLLESLLLYRYLKRKDWL